MEITEMGGEQWGRLMKEEKVEKGKILARGIRKQEYLNSRKGHRNAFLKSIPLIFISIFMMAELFWANEWGFKEIAGLILIIFVLLVGIIAAWVYRPSTWGWIDAVYENGISSTYTPFTTFQEINKIGYGVFKTKNYGDVEFIKIFSKYKSWKKTPSIQSVDYENDYFERVKEILKKKCPDVPWVEMEWLEWKRKGG